MDEWMDTSIGSTYHIFIGPANRLAFSCAAGLALPCLRVHLSIYATCVYICIFLYAHHEVLVIHFCEREDMCCGMRDVTGNAIQNRSRRGEGVYNRGGSRRSQSRSFLFFHPSRDHTKPGLLLSRHLPTSAQRREAFSPLRTD